MNTEPFKDIENYLADNSKKIDELKDDIIEINKFSVYCGEQNRKLALDLNNIMKFFYPKQVKAQLGKYSISDKKSSYMSEKHVQISKRGIGYAYYTESNMDTFSKFFSDEYAMSNVFTNKELFKKVKSNLNERGQLCFDELKALVEKYNLDYEDKEIVFNVEQNKLAEKITEIPKTNSLIIETYNSGVELKVADKDKSSYYHDKYCLIKFHNTANSISYANKFGAKIVFLIYYDEIKNLLSTQGKIAKEQNNKWCEFVDEINSITAKYLLVQAI